MAAIKSAWWISVLALAATTAHAGPWTVSGRMSRENSAGQSRMLLSVSDENGLPVTGLTADSFKVGSVLCDANGNGCGVHQGSISAVSERSDAAGAGVYIVAFEKGQRPGVVTSGYGEAVVRVGTLRVVSATPGAVRREFVQRAQQIFSAP